MLRLNGLSAGYAIIEVVHEVSFELDLGQKLALVGLNGAGKTTLLEAIAGFVETKAGEITFEGKPLGNLRSDERACLGIALVPEKRNLFPELSAWENLQLGRCSAPHQNRWSKGAVAAAAERVFELFPKLKEIRDRQVSVMSGGEQQMVAVGRALMAEPKVLMLDEPSQGLAPQLVEAMYEAIQKVAKGTTVLLVEQDMELARSVTTNLMLMQDGRVRPLLQQELEDEELMRREIFGQADVSLAGK